MIEYFNATSPFGNFTGWAVTNGANPTTTKQRAQALGADGDELRHKGYDKRQTLSATYTSTLIPGSTATYLTLPSVGTVVNGAHIDSISVAYSQTGFPTLTVSGHKHLDGNAHVAGGCRTYAASVQLPAVEFGVPSVIPNVGTGAGNAFALDDEAEIGMRSLTYTLGLQHVDDLDGQGEHLAGDNYDGVETLAIELTGTGTLGTDFEIGDDWFDDSIGETPSNTAATTTSLSLSHHVAHTVSAAA